MNQEPDQIRRNAARLLGLTEERTWQWIMVTYWNRYYGFQKPLGMDELMWVIVKRTLGVADDRPIEDLPKIAKERRLSEHRHIFAGKMTDYAIMGLGVGTDTFAGHEFNRAIDELRELWKEVLTKLFS